MERYILIDTMRQYPMELKNYPEVQDDEEIVRLAVKKNGEALAYASQRLRADYETVMIAVKKNGLSLEYASDELRRNPKIISAAIQSDGCALGFVPEDLQRDRQLVLEAATNGCGWSLIPEEFHADKEIVLEVINNYNGVYPMVPDELADDMEIILAAMEHYNNFIEVVFHLPDSVLGDKEKMLQIVALNSCALEYASEELKKDKELALAALDSAIQYYNKYCSPDESFRPSIPAFANELMEDPDIKEKLDPYLYADACLCIPWEIQCHIEVGNIAPVDFEKQVMAVLKDYGIEYETVRVVDDEYACVIRLDLSEVDEDGYCAALDDESIWESWIDELNEKFGAPYEEDED